MEQGRSTKKGKKEKEAIEPNVKGKLKTEI